MSTPTLEAFKKINKLGNQSVRSALILISALSSEVGLNGLIDTFQLNYSMILNGKPNSIKGFGHAIGHFGA